MIISLKSQRSWQPLISLNSCLQNWFAFSKPLKKPLFIEHDSIDFLGTNNTNPPPLDENNNAYCKVRIGWALSNQSQNISF